MPQLVSDLVPGEAAINGRATNGSASNGIAGTSGTAPHEDSMDCETEQEGQSNGAAQSFQPLRPGSAIDRRELVRLTLQALTDLGYECVNGTPPTPCSVSATDQPCPSFV